MANNHVQLGVIIGSVRTGRIAPVAARWLLSQLGQQGEIGIDTARDEWRAKPVGFVSYGGLAGGLRDV
jgi:hypothetical protein